MESACPLETLATTLEMTVWHNYIRTKSSYCASCGRVRHYLLFCWHSCRSCAPIIFIVHSAVCWRCVGAPHHSSAPFSWVVGREGCHLNRITHHWEQRGGAGRTVLKDMQLVSSTHCFVVCSVLEIECFQSWLDWFQSNQDNRQSSKKNNKYQLLYVYRCTSWWWA
jgi:hypothetical protein